MPDAEAIAGTRQNMLGADVLDAVSRPEIRVVAKVSVFTPGGADAEVYFSLLGNGRLMILPVRIERDGQSIRVRGSGPLLQSAFGITPFSVFGAALSVCDAAELEFVIVGGK